MRADHDLAFMMQYENIAWYENGKVRILDRRVYPAKVEFVECSTYQEVAQALADMVTQSAGPYSAAPMGMALAAYQCREMSAEKQLQFLRDAAYCMSHARPTTTKRIEAVTGISIKAAEKAMAEGKDVVEAIFNNALEQNEDRYSTINYIAKNLVDKFPDKGSVMTQCFAETALALMLREAKERGKDIRLFCPETRPYFQGARLTATVAAQQGYDVTVITDNMPAYVMSKEGIDLFTCAADAICCDGYVVNKVGTYQIAIAAKYHNVPVWVTGAPDPGHPTIDTITIEQRDPEFVLQAMGVRTAAEGVKGYYPAFDITPPELISGIVTPKGVYSPLELNQYFKDKGPEAGVVV